MNNSVLFGLKRARVKFKVLETTVSHRLQVSRKKYEVVYRLETEEGTIAFNFDQQIRVETDSRKEGSELVSFTRFQPVVAFTGVKTKNGECSIRLYEGP